jgi:hypothetical protein
MYKTYKPHYPWLIVDMLKGRLKCLYRKRYKPSNLPSETPTIATNPSNLPSEMPPRIAAKPSIILNEMPTITTEPSSIPSEMPTISATLIITNESTISNDKDSHHTGRPVGTTTENMLLIKKIRNCCSSRNHPSVPTGDE